MNCHCVTRQNVTGIAYNVGALQAASKDNKLLELKKSVTKQKYWLNVNNI